MLSASPMPGLAAGAVRGDAAPRAPRRDPMQAVLGLDGSGQNVVRLCLLAAFFIHGTAAARAAALPLELMQWSQAIGRAIHVRITEVYDVDLLKPEPRPPPPPAPEPEPPKEEPKAPRLKPSEPPPAAAAAAKAGAVITQAPDPNEPVDLTNSFVTGNADSYAGGVTQSTGTSDSAVRALNVAPGGRGNGAAAVEGPSGNGPDRSRPARLAGSKDWKCDFPPEADIDQIDQAFVIVQVATHADGTPDHVTILQDPGHGFARAARVCAMKEHYDPAFDREGNAVAGSTKSIRIRFER
jgi:periplasmic protein TonB